MSKENEESRNSRLEEKLQQRHQGRKSQDLAQGQHSPTSDPLSPPPRPTPDHTLSIKQTFFKKVIEQKNNGLIEPKNNLAVIKSKFLFL